MTESLPNVPVNSIWKYKHSKDEFYIVVKVTSGTLVPTLGYLADVVYLRNMLTGRFDGSSWEFYSKIIKNYERIDNA